MSSEKRRGDRVYTPRDVAADMIASFPIGGRVLEPFRGGGVFTDLRPEWEWCEIDEGRDFFDWHEPVDWIVSNPPYSKLRPVWRHASTVAESILFLIPLRNFFSGYGFVREALDFGGIPAIRLYGTGAACGFPMGNAIGAVWWQRGYRGQTRWSDYRAGEPWRVLEYPQRGGGEG